MDTIILDSLDDIPEVDSKTAVILPDGRRGFLHPGNDDIRNERGHIMVQGSGSSPAFTRDTAREAVKKREALRARAVQEAIIQGTGAKDLAGGIEYLAVQLVEVVKTGQGRDKVVAFKELMRHGSLAGDLGRGATVHGGPGASAGGLGPEAWQALNVILPALRDRLGGE